MASLSSQQFMILLAISFTLLLFAIWKNEIPVIGNKFMIFRNTAPVVDPMKEHLIKTLTLVMNLKSTESRIFSQNNEDGVIQALFNRIGTKSKYYVEFGVQDGIQCNSRLLRERYGWKGLMMDGGFNNSAINLQREMVFPHNIVKLFEKYRVPKKFDLLVVDTDFKDFWLTQKILAAGYRPRVIIGEVNSFMGPEVALTVPIDWNGTHWDGTRFFGYSVRAGWRLARHYGYSMVYCESNGVNCFYVIDGAEGFGEGIRISDYLNETTPWNQPCNHNHAIDPKKRPLMEIKNDMKYS